MSSILNHRAGYLRVWVRWRGICHKIKVNSLSAGLSLDAPLSDYKLSFQRRLVDGEINQTEFVNFRRKKNTQTQLFYTGH